MDILKYRSTEIRSSAVLTTSYVAGTIIGLPTPGTDLLFTDNQTILYIDFTKGSLTSAEFILEFSDDNVNWYQETLATITGGAEIDTALTHQLTNSGKYRIATEIKDRYFRVSFKGTGTVTSSLLSCIAIYGTS